MSGLEIRAVEATVAAEIAAAVDVFLRSFAGQENARLGAAYAAATLRSYASARECSLLAAWDGSRMAGFAAGERAGGRVERYRALRSQVAAAFLRRPWLLMDPSILRMAALRLTGDAGEELPPDPWFLGVMGVDPDCQGRGVGRMLLGSFEDEGRRRGFADAALFVHESNVRARAFYERAGWRVSRGPHRGRLLLGRSLATR